LCEQGRKVSPVLFVFSDQRGEVMGVDESREARG
jgi:hypothetical protein